MILRTISSYLGSMRYISRLTESYLPYVRYMIR